MNERYWSEKVALFLHDPVHKALKIPGHEERAEEIVRTLFQAPMGKDRYSPADRIASGLARASLPPYSSNAEENGAIDFITKPTITHPLVANDNTLSFTLPENISIDYIHHAVLELLKQDLGLNKQYEELRSLPESIRPLNGYYDHSNSPEEWSKALYFYLFFALRKRLEAKNLGGLGGLWSLLPADTRMPDHSIWQHCALTSAIGSSMAQDPSNRVSMVAFSISPVQAYISKARKLRDLWTGSVILSYLAFTGIREVANRIGPDHILYPSLQDQSLVHAWIARDFHINQSLLGDGNGADTKDSIASFPNKFVFICSTTQVAELNSTVKEAIQKEWIRLSKFVLEDIKQKTKESSVDLEHLEKLFNNQITDFWDFQYASARILDLADVPALQELIPNPKIWENEQRVQEIFSNLIKDGGNTARLYGCSHSLVQRLLASSKLKPLHIRKSQNGEKCPLCGEYEVLHGFAQAGTSNAKKYSEGIKEFWDIMRSKLNAPGSASEIGEHERLCAVCLTKRMLPRVLRPVKDEILSQVFKDSKFFSTTELAFKSYLDKLRVANLLSKDNEDRIVQALHSMEVEDTEDEEHSKFQAIVNEASNKGIKEKIEDHYYAVLLMDGDKMGDLINGETLSATWGSSLHPELLKRIQAPGFKKGTLKVKIGEEMLINQKRLINPSIHAAISDGLNSFARYAVAPTIKEAEGRLIYAGGDDVCAVLPLETVLMAADKIQKSYGFSFVQYTKDGAEKLESTAHGCNGKFGRHLGRAPGISISAAIVIAHHKDPLKAIIQEAHEVLDREAKQKAGRNALAIRLKKRSGGDRDFACKWDLENIFIPGETVLQSFHRVMTGVKTEIISTRLIYNLESLRGAVEPFLKQDFETHKEKILKLFSYEIGHSGKATDSSAKEFSARLAGICIQKMDGGSGNTYTYNPEAAIIANFLSKRGVNDE